VPSRCWKSTLDSADQLRDRRAQSIGGMGPQDPKDVSRDIARDLTELVGEIAALKGDATHWLKEPEYATLKHRLEDAAVEAALIEARRRVRLNEGRES
jgi:hypothetical protein